MPCLAIFCGEDDGTEGSCVDATGAIEGEARNDELRPFTPVTNEDRTAMGVHNPDTRPTLVKPPEAGPVFSSWEAGGRLPGDLTASGVCSMSK
jgi:hypothetical protein